MLCGYEMVQLHVELTSLSRLQYAYSTGKAQVLWADSSLNYLESITAIGRIPVHT